MLWLMPLSHLAPALSKVGGKEIRICGGGHENDLQGAALGQQVPQQQQQQVSVQAALVHLIHYHMAHPFQLGITQQPPEQDTWEARSRSAKDRQLPVCHSIDYILSECAQTRTA